MALLKLPCPNLLITIHTLFSAFWFQFIMCIAFGSKSPERFLVLHFNTHTDHYNNINVIYISKEKNHENILLIHVAWLCVLTSAKFMYIPMLWYGMHASMEEKKEKRGKIS